MSTEPPSVETPPDAGRAVSRCCRRASLVGAGVGAACGAAVAFLAAWYFSTPSASAGAYALPGSIWRVKHQGKDIFVEFREDMSLMNWDTPPGAPGIRGGSDFGRYEIIARDKVRLNSPLGAGRFGAVLAGDNLVFESRSSSDRLFLYRSKK